MFEVFIESVGGVKQHFTQFETEAEAESFCRENNWEYIDKNGFCWEMDYREMWWI